MKKFSENRGRFVGLLIVVLFVATALAGAVYVNGGTSEPVTSASPSVQLISQDVTIGTGYNLTTWSLSDGTQYMQGNLTIASGGVVTLSNESLVFDQFAAVNSLAGYEASTIYHITVQDGGQLILYHSKITTNLQLINDIPVLGVLVQNGGSVSMYDNSSMVFPGQLVVSGGSLTMVDSAVSGFSSSSFNPHYVNSTFFPTGIFDNPPVASFFAANVLMENSALSIYQNNATPTQSNPANVYKMTYPFAADTGSKNTVQYTIEGIPTLVNTAAPLADSTTGQSISSLAAYDSSVYSVAQGQRMAVTGFTTGGVDSPLVSASLHISYKTQLNAATTLNWAYGNTSTAIASVNLPGSTAGYTNVSLNLPGTLTTNDLSRMLTWMSASASTGTVSVNKLWIELSFSENAYKNVTVAGSSSFTAIGGFIGADFSSNASQHASLAVSDTAHSYLYNVHIDQTSVYNASSMNQSAFFGNLASMLAKPLTFGPLNSGPGGNSLALVDSNGATSYGIPSNAVFQTYGMNVTADSTLNTKLASAVLSVSSNSSTGVSISVGLVGQPVSSYKSTGIRITTGIGGVYSVNLKSLGFASLSDISNLVIYIQNGGTTTYINNVNVQVQMLPQAYIYRFANVTIYSSQGLPVSGTSISLYYTGSTPNNVTAGSSAGYFAAPGNVYQTTPPNDVLSYLGRTVSTYDVTDQIGTAVIPLLSDVIDASTFPDSMAVGNYTAVASYNSTNYGNSISFSPYPIVTPQSEMLSVNITIGVTLPLPEIQVGTPYITPSTVYFNQTVTLSFNVSDVGQTGVNSMSVNVSDGANGNFVSFYETKVSVAPVSTTLITLQWHFSAAGNNTISVSANMNKSIPESSYAGDTNSTVIYVLPNLPELVIPASGITFNPSPAHSGKSVTITAAVENFLGRAPALNMTVAFYSGNPLGGGVEIGHSLMNISAKGSNTTSISWIPNTIGSTPIYVYLDPSHSIQQYSTSGNLNYSVLSIILSIGQQDLIVNNTNSQPTSPFTIRSSINMSSNIVVTQSGYLLMDNGGVNFIETYATQFSFLINQTSKVVIENSVLQSNYPINLIVTGNSQLFIINSVIGSNVSFMSGGNAHIWLNSTTVKGAVTPAAYSSALLYSFNSTYSKPIVVGYNEVARLYNASAPYVSAQASSVAYIYRWLAVTAYGRLGATVQGATVTLYTFANQSNPTGAFYASGISQTNGLVLFAGISDILTSSSDTYMGNYIVNTSFNEAGIWYAPEVPASLAHYSVPLQQVNSFVSSYLSINLPDLAINSTGISVSSNYIVEESTYTVSAVVYNIGFAPLTQNFTVTFSMPGAGPVNVTSSIPSPLPVNSATTIQTTWSVPLTPGNVTIGVTVNPSRVVPEISYSNNFAQASFIVYSLPNLVPISINATGSFQEYANVTFNVAVSNLGQAPAINVTVQIVDGNSTANMTNPIANGTIPLIIGGSTSVISIPWTIPQLPSNTVKETLYFGAIVNKNHTIKEANYTNNSIASALQINITQAQVIALAQVSSTSIKTGAVETVTLTVTSKLANKPMGNYPVTIILYNIRGLPQNQVKFTGQTNSNGKLVASIPIPASQSQGAYHFEVFSNGQYVTSTASFNVASTSVNTGIPLYMLLLIVVAAVGAFVGFSAYLYRYGLARVVECGNCGSFIPETSRKCQYCGVEFEAGTAKCSNCSSWIPAASKQCPICGVKFADEGDGDEDDIVSSEMSKEYASFVEKFKAQAKIDMGNKYSEKSFLSWWKKQPTYLTFEDWLSRQQTAKKATMVKCPVCNELNPEASKECVKCGSPLVSQKEETKAQQPPKQPPATPEGKPAPAEPRRIVVPKRVIRKVEERSQTQPQDNLQPNSGSENENGQDGGNAQ